MSSRTEYNQKLYSRAADRATNELEENTVWAMAEVHSSADEAIEIADDLQETIRKIAYVSKMKLNLGVNREMHGKNKVLEAASLAEGSGTEINGIFALVSSANIDEPDLVIAKFTFKKYFSRLLLKLNISKSILFFS